MQKTVIVSGVCPESGKTQRIEAKIAIITMCGSATPGHKVMSYYCPYADDLGCASRGDTGMDCPLYKKARAEYR